MTDDLPTLAGKIVLVLEDSPIEAKLISELLEARGATCFIASDLDVALSVCQSLKVHLITVDIDLGNGLNGFDLLESLQNRMGSAFSPGVIVVSSHADRFDIKMRISDLGLKCALIKPFFPNQLQEAVQLECA